MKFYLRVFMAFWTVGLLVFMVKNVGVWPFGSYTMLSWTLLTIRNIAMIFGWYNIATILSYPTLVQNTVTVLIWWMVLVPIIYFTKLPEERNAFLEFNKQPFLINVHFLNLGLATLDVYMAPRTLTMADLWISILIAFLYLTFYLLVLDRVGAHIYIILSPRTKWCVLVYAGLIGVYIGMFNVWNVISANMI
jgi:hypothetical protein